MGRFGSHTDPDTSLAPSVHCAGHLMCCIAGPHPQLQQTAVTAHRLLFESRCSAGIQLTVRHANPLLFAGASQLKHPPR